MAGFAVQDFVSALKNVQCWAFLATKQIQFEYRRSLAGSLWIVLAFALTAGGIGSIMAQLQGIPIVDHVPYVMFGFAAWNFILGMVQGGCGVFVNAKPYLLQMPIQRSVFVLSLTLRNLYLLVIHLGTSVVLAAILGWVPTLQALWVVPAIVVFIFAGIGTALVLGHLCARVPDLAQFIGAIMRLAFFFVPIIWIADVPGRGQIGGFVGILMRWNPFTHVLSTFRDGLLGYGPDLVSWIVLLSCAVGLLVLGAIILQLMGRRLTYWL